MLTRQPDYTISELGHPIHQWSDSTTCESLKKLDYRKMPSSPPSPHRLLPLRETLDDCFKRLAMRSRDFDEDPVYQQKLRKNQWNEQQRKRNQKCRDRAESGATMTTTTIAATCDLNNF
ncbi:uncharacterized protein LOC6542211 isoform X2 [Drosophila erecta]|uniref:Uncharacterized protein, isoform A n=1 Tax=Drosophila erecta TaxID=7220 RepID=B3N8G9_DROER|nr:uncharacterized protein LOC6542211 isoform X2 [Drosophila erecta]EDV58392.1 uncharacterized protein Dere_GG24015, isoform A [Drosophila erecta]